MDDQVLNILRMGLLVAQERRAVGAFARGADGRSVEPTSADAVSFCALGLIKALTQRGAIRAEIEPQVYNYLNTGSVSVTYDNDQSLDSALAMHRRAIARRERELGL